MKNLFNSYVEDVIPDPFIRLSILQWLKNRFHILGPTLAKGYHKIEVLLLDLVSYGHKESRILIELESLIRANCITTETQSVNTDTENLISITASGIVHLDLLGNIDYLSSVSEDTYFNNLVEAEKIKNNIVGANISHHLNRQVSLENSNIIIDYLIKYKSYFPNNPEIFLDKGSFTDLINISKAKKQIDDARDPKGLAQQKSLLIKKYPRGTVINARISGIKRHGIFFEIGLDARGFIHTSDVKNNDDPSYIQTHYEVGEYIDVEINSFYDKHNNFRVKIV